MYNLIVGLLMVGLLATALSPLFLATFYLFARPLIQPIAVKNIPFMLGIPLVGIVPVLFVTIAFAHSFYRQNYSISNKRIVCFYVLIFLASPSIYFSPSTTESIAFVIKLLTAVFMYCLIYGAIKNENDTEKLLIPIIIQSWIINIYGYYQYINGRNRIASLLVEPNFYGEYLCLLLGATLIVMLRTKKKWMKIFLLATSFAIAIAMVLAQNRGSWIATAFALVVSSILYGRRINFAKLVVPIAIVAIFFSGIVIQRFQQLNTLSEAGYSQNTFHDRIETWFKMLKLVPMSPIVGHGIGSSFSIGEKYYGVKIAPHNDYVRIVLESGVPALFIYVGFLLSILVSSIIRAWRYENWWAHFPVLFVICYWMVISITQNIVSNVSIFPLFMALVAVGDKMAKLEDETAKMPGTTRQCGRIAESVQ